MKNVSHVKEWHVSHRIICPIYLYIPKRVTSYIWSSRHVVVCACYGVNSDGLSRNPVFVHPISHIRDLEKAMVTVAREGRVTHPICPVWLHRRGYLCSLHDPAGREISFHMYVYICILHECVHVFFTTSLELGVSTLWVCISTCSH